VKKIVLIAGDGGHSGIAKALTPWLMSADVKLVFLISSGNPMRNWFKERGEVVVLPKPRGPKTPWHLFLVGLFLSFIQSLRLLPSDASVAVSCGSNFAVAPAIVSRLYGIPLVNIETRTAITKPSKTAELLQDIADLTILQWPEQQENLNGVVYGPIVYEAPERDYASSDLIVVSTGTYDYLELMDVMKDSVFRGLMVVQTPNTQPRDHPYNRMIGTTENFEATLRLAHIAVVQAGSTAMEATVMGLKVIIVPPPEWSKACTPNDAVLFAEKIGAEYAPALSLEILDKAIYKAYKRGSSSIDHATEEIAQRILAF